MGANGGFAFLIVYLLLVLFVGFVVMVGELALGRKSGLGVVGTYKKLSKEVRWLGWLGISSAFLIMSFYTVLGGYVTKYIVVNLGDIFGASWGSGGLAAGDLFNGLLTNQAESIIYSVIFLALTCLIVMGGISGGIEKFTKYAMPALFVMLLVVIIRSVTLPGAGISCFACSEANMAYMEKLLTVQVISFDKVNQQRHVLYLKDKAHTLELMKKHAAIMGPKFRCVVDALDREIAPLEIASWRRPKGGYFVSLNAMPGTAKRTLALCKEAGVTMTGAGATFPYGKDPQDSNIRIAPSLPPVEELEQAIAVLCVCLKMAALEKLGV